MKRFAVLLAITLLLPLSLRADNVPLDTNALATLAVQDHGRKKPFTTFAHEMLLSLSGHATYALDNADGTKTTLSPEQVVLDLWFKPDGWDDRPLIMINFLELKQKLGVDETQKLFSFNELIKKQALMDLLDEAQRQRQAGKGDTLPAYLKEAEQLGQRMQLFKDLVEGTKETIVPDQKLENGHWLPIQGLSTDDVTAITNDPSRLEDDNNVGGWGPNQYEKTRGAIKAWADAYANDDITKFNTQTPVVVDALRAIARQFYPGASSLQFEHTYMVVDPFMWAWIIYFCALLVLLLTAIWARSVGYLVGWALVALGLGFEVYGFACRIIISGRPPVTDLYETVIWVSFIGMVFAVILEAVYRKRYFLYAGLPAAILTLIVADSDSTILDASINPLTAVLRNNMWLTIHVLTIVSSYAAFVLTAALGHIALTMTFWGKRYAKAQAEVHFYIYRAMQIGILLLATGTILGGVWANYSWGRFWGWDPKETWALITLLCYLALVHGRLAGWWKGFGLAVGSVVCFLSVMMSWYGVNFILGQNGKSLHSYGLSTGGLGYASGFAGFELAFVILVIWWNQRSAAVRSASAANDSMREVAGQRA
ncbi:MAG TPA: cytochrome c biogenesis protein CcsA [Candidatus Methylacidiphilales bacterium]|jgi:ABC-type transport system involved in cytochrome c biogenesis permease subunit|nr:cytochrome c biogenesis protein CcsA [Candidatus Methylacidiphilales bacterium]